MGLENLVAGDLTIEVKEAVPPAPVQLIWKGKSNDRNPNKLLGPFFSSVLQAASRSAAPVELHFETLEYLNSSTITAIIQLIQTARPQKIKLAMVFDQSIKWQRLSCDALRIFARGDGLLELRSS